MNPLRATSRQRLKGAATPAARPERVDGWFRSASGGTTTSRRIGVCLASSGTTGLLRTEAVANRRGMGSTNSDWGRLQ